MFLTFENWFRVSTSCPPWAQIVHYFFFCRVAVLGLCFKSKKIHFIMAGWSWTYRQEQLWHCAVRRSLPSSDNWQLQWVSLLSSTPARRVWMVWKSSFAVMMNIIILTAIVLIIVLTALKTNSLLQCSLFPLFMNDAIQQIYPNKFAKRGLEI